MENVLLAAVCILSILLAVLFIYHLYYRKNIRHITKQLTEIIDIMETNEIITVKASQEDINLLVNVLNDLIKDIRLSRIKVKRMTMRFRQGITNISHDLRTPLTTASGYVQMLQNNVSEEERQEYLKIILERQDMVKMLLEQLFEYVRLESGEITYECTPIDAKKVFVDTLAMYYEDFNKNNEEPEVNLLAVPCTILGNEQGLKRIFSNIIFNGIVHGKGGFCFEIKEEEEKYIFSFSNNSEVMTKDDLEKIFDRFYTKDKSRHKKTTGLGLAIAKEITNQLNGKIEALYDEGKFIICISFLKLN